MPKSIYRIAYTKRNGEKNPGWRAAVVFRGKSHVKFFSDAKYGKDGEKAALRWRNATEKSLGKRRSESLIGQYSGPHIIKIEDRVYFEASWTESGKRRRKRFSIARFGFRKARSMAKAVL